MQRNLVIRRPEPEILNQVLDDETAYVGGSYGVDHQAVIRNIVMLNLFQYLSGRFTALQTVTR